MALFTHAVSIGGARDVGGIESFFRFYVNAFVGGSLREEKDHLLWCLFFEFSE